MRPEKKQELECLVEFLNSTNVSVYHIEYNAKKRALITFAYGLSLDLTDPDARAFYDAFKEMRDKRVK